ncbi:MAG: hypothetical protein H6623_08085 [Bdellovibrionaceae bacterium]|nr:hypothetical protein [Pseudobdellovibrionaceae bacterium]
MKKTLFPIFTFSLLLFISAWSFAEGETLSTITPQASSTSTEEELQLPKSDPAELPTKSVDSDNPSALKYVDIVQGSTIQERLSRRPSSDTKPERYIDTSLGVACYYIIPPQTPGVVTATNAAISCVKLDKPKEALPTTPIPLRNQSND